VCEGTGVGSMDEHTPHMSATSGSRGHACYRDPVAPLHRGITSDRRTAAAVPGLVSVLKTMRHQVNPWDRWPIIIIIIIIIIGGLIGRTSLGFSTSLTSAAGGADAPSFCPSRVGSGIDSSQPHIPTNHDGHATSTRNPPGFRSSTPWTFLDDRSSLSLCTPIDLTTAYRDLEYKYLSLERQHVSCRTPPSAEHHHLRNRATKPLHRPGQRYCYHQPSPLLDNLAPSIRTYTNRRKRYTLI
jgi:hypothetical protein